MPNYRMITACNVSAYVADDFHAPDDFAATMLACKGAEDAHEIDWATQTDNRICELVRVSDLGMEEVIAQDFYIHDEARAALNSAAPALLSAIKSALPVVAAEIEQRAQTGSTPALEALNTLYEQLDSAARLAVTSAYTKSKESNTPAQF